MQEGEIKSPCEIDQYATKMRWNVHHFASSAVTHHRCSHILV